MKTNLYKLLIKMSKWCIYGIVIQLSVYTIAFALDSKAQNKSVHEIQISLDLKSPTKLEQVLKSVENSTDFHFSFRDNQLKSSSYKMDLKSGEYMLSNLLLTISKQTDLSFRRINNNIYIAKKQEGVERIKESNELVDVAVSGTITDENGQPLPGASVVVKGTTNGTTTDVDGNFKLDCPADAVLTISFVGYQAQEVSVNNQSVIDIALSLDSEQLQEVVVVGYGVQEKDKVTGAITTRSGEDLVKSNAGDISNALAGRVPGIIAVQDGGEPGLDESEILIRGRATFNNNGPLVMVDGIQRDMNEIDPNEIESISVLKDAAAVAIYGVRGGNGVILITTKRGSLGKPEFSYTGYVGFQNPTQTPDYLNAYDYARLYNEALLNDDPNATPVYSEDDLQKYKDGSSPYTHPDVDWFDEVITPNAPQSRHSLSVKGGTEKVKYFMLLGLFNQEGMYNTVKYKKYNFRLNVDTELTSSTTLSIGLFGGLERKKEPGMPDASTYDDGIYGYLTYLPNNIFPVRNEDGTLASLWGRNPIGDIYESGNINKNTNTVQSSFTLNQKLDFITEGLSFKAIYAKDLAYQFNKYWLIPYKTYDSYGDELVNRYSPELTEEFTQFDNSTFEVHLNYSRSFGKHQINVLALYTQSTFYDNSFFGAKYNYVSSAVPQLFAGSEDEIETGDYASESGREGVVGRLSYNFDQRYLLEANFGYNGSENFPANKRYGFFPAASIGWMLSNESFFNSLSNTINVLKIRASYGEVGNDRVGGRRFLYIPTITYSGGYVFDGQPAQGVTLGEPANPNVTWERARKTNLGIDASIKGSLLNFRGDLFYENRTNILGSRNRSVPATYGFELPVENFAEINNRGFEVEINHQGNAGQLSYFVGLNYTYARNEVVFIDEPANIPEYRQQTGKPMNQWFGYIHEGFYQTQEQINNDPKFEFAEPQLGDIKYKDINNDGVINTDDISAVGNSDIPQSVFGVTLGGNFRGFDLNMLWQGAAGYNVDWKWPTIEFIYGTQAWEHHKDRWTPENPDASYPRLSLSQYDYKQEPSSFWIRDQAYIRLKNIELGYTIPKTLFPEGTIQKLRVYISASNILTFSKQKEFDPEAPTSHYRTGLPFYPQQKGVFGGVNLTF